MDRRQSDADVRVRGATARRIARAVACAFFVFHLVAITLANVPRTTALGTGLHAPFARYTWFAGLWQTWDMFTTIPHWADIDVFLTARNAEGREVLHGPMLPGLERYRRLPDFGSDQGLRGGRHGGPDVQQRDATGLD